MYKRKPDNPPAALWYVDDIPALEKIPDDILGKLLMASLYRIRDGTDTDFSKEPLADMFWELYKPKQDANSYKYKKQKEGGSSGGRYRAYKDAEEKAGCTPMDYDTWNEFDERRKYQMESGDYGINLP